MPESIKKVPKRKYDDIRLTFLGKVLLIAFCIALLVISTFWQMNISYFSIPSNLFEGTSRFPADFVSSYKIFPQIPVVMFLTAFLGKKYGLSTVLIYLIIGLCGLPIFALGGGYSYIFEYGFGYLLGFIPAVFFAGSIVKSGLSYRNIAQASIVGVLIIHLIGILYMLFIGTIKQEGWTFMSSWIVYQSGVKIIYDFVLSFFGMLVARYVKILLWFYMK